MVEIHSDHSVTLSHLSLGWFYISNMLTMMQLVWKGNKPRQCNGCQILFKKKVLKEIFTSGQHGHKFWMHCGKSLYSLSSCYCNTSLYLCSQKSERNRERAPSGWRQGVKAGHRLSHRLETHLQSAFSATHLAVSHISINTAGVTFRCGKVKLGVLQIVPAGKHWNNRDLELN